MTAIPADLFTVAPSRSRRVGRVLEALLGTLWRMRLARDGFRDAERVIKQARGHAEKRKWTAGRIGLSTRRHYGYYNEKIVSGIEPNEFAADCDQRREFYRYIEQGRWSIRDPKDRRIADALAEGGSYRDIMRKERVGQYRIERVLFTLVQGRNPPWHWRTGKPREKAGQKKRQSVERKWRRRRASTQP